MTIKKARELLGDIAGGKSDEEIQRDIEAATFFADLMIDKIKSMSPDERKMLL